MGSQKFKWFLVVTSQMSATSGKGVNNELFICSPFFIITIIIIIISSAQYTLTTFVHK